MDPDFSSDALLLKALEIFDTHNDENLRRFITDLGEREDLEEQICLNFSAELFPLIGWYMESGLATGPFLMAMSITIKMLKKAFIK
jgi:hypothetical protein